MISPHVATMQRNGQSHGRSQPELHLVKRSTVHPLDDLTKWEIGIAVLEGFGDRAIRRDFPWVTERQIQTVVKEIGVKRIDYRNGTSQFAQLVRKRNRVVAKRMAQKLLTD